MEKIEIARSFSYKLNIGDYENADFFCSAKQEANEKDFPQVAEKLFQLCMRQVFEDIHKNYDLIRAAKSRKFEIGDQSFMDEFMGPDDPFHDIPGEEVGK